MSHFRGATGSKIAIGSRPAIGGLRNARGVGERCGASGLQQKYAVFAWEKNVPPSIRDYMTQPLATRLSAAENAVREEVMQAMMTTGRAYALAGSPHRAVIEELAARNIVALADEAVVAAYPVSARPTNKRVQLADGREAYAMCALDALGFHYAFAQEVRIAGVCEHCGEAIELRMRGGRVEMLSNTPDVYVLHADLQNESNWSCSCCNIMHFFTCRQLLEDWRRQHIADGRKTFALDLETANKMAWLLFAR